MSLNTGHDAVRLEFGKMPKCFVETQLNETHPQVDAPNRGYVNANRDMGISPANSLNDSQLTSLACHLQCFTPTKPVN